MKDIISNDVVEILADETIPWERLKNSKVIITGASGLIGRYFLYTLCALNSQRDYGIKVTAIVRDRNKIENDHRIQNVDFIEKDLSFHFEPNLAADFFIHAAGIASPSLYCNDPVKTIRTSTISTDILLECAYKCKAERFLLLSSGEVYGVLPSDKSTDEGEYGPMDPLTRRASYGEGKRIAETMCYAWNKQYQVPTVIARLGHTFGPSISLMDDRAFSVFIKNVVFGEDIVLESDGSAMRTFCYMTDAIRALFLVLLKGECGEAYNVINSNNYHSIREFAFLLAELPDAEKTKVVFGKGAAPQIYRNREHRLYPPNIEKTLALGWRPRVFLKEGIERTVEHIVSSKKGN